MEACRLYGRIKKFVHVSTDEVYGEVHEGSADENTILNPLNPYAATKAGAEYIVRSYGTSFKFPFVITRGNNVYGPN
jgi:dTDP-D-glucose 4,6-dehydratase